MLLSSNISLLLFIDIQENTINSIYQHEQLTANCKDLLIMAKAFKVPVLTSEHLPQKNGSIIACLDKLIPQESHLSKKHFSCCIEISKKIKSYSQIILTGIETHLCVLQTAIELLEEKKQVFIVVDATASKFEKEKFIALTRMQQLGAQLVTKQMVLFEWARTADHPKFKKLSDRILK